MSFYCGLDLVQAQDPSALSILEAHGDEKTRSYDVRYLEQFALGIPYPRIVDAVKTLLARAPLRRDCGFAIDHTGVGRAVGDMFVEAGLHPIGITITGGAGWHRERAREWHVAKILLVGTVQKFLQSGRLRIGSSLKHADTLQAELRDFRVQVTKAANEVYSSREGAHDDLVLSVAVALFAAEHPGPRFLPVVTTPQEPEDSFHEPTLRASLPIDPADWLRRE